MKSIMRLGFCLEYYKVIVYNKYTKVLFVHTKSGKTLMYAYELGFSVYCTSLN